MEWSDQAFVLSSRPYGEGSALIALLTREHGRHNGLVRGGASRRERGTYQPGNKVAAIWKGRLEEQLGNLRCEALGPGPAAFLDDPSRLACISASCALCEFVLPEREPHAVLFDAVEALLASLAGEDWASVYVRWELALLRELGFGLDLSCCAATGRNDALAYVSPKSGRAVSLSAGEPYRDRLLALPSFLIEGGPGDSDAVLSGLRLTGFFLDRHVAAPKQQKLPAARTRFIDRLRG